MGQALNGFVEADDYGDDNFDLCNDGMSNIGEPFCYVENWNGWKMKATCIEKDETLPFPHFPLPFAYDLQAEFVQPDDVSIKKRPPSISTQAVRLVAAE